MGHGEGGGTSFGQLLRWWRARRGLSQLDLAGIAGSSQRHLSFLESGRTRPSREMILRLAQALEVPTRRTSWPPVPAIGTMARMTGGKRSTARRQAAARGLRLDPASSLTGLSISRGQPRPAPSGPGTAAGGGTSLPRRAATPTWHEGPDPQGAGAAAPPADLGYTAPGAPAAPRRSP